MAPRVPEAAPVPPPTVNWPGEEVVSFQAWTASTTELPGVGFELRESTSAIPAVAVDLTKQHELIGKTEIPWKDGFRRMVAARHPELPANVVVVTGAGYEGRTKRRGHFAGGRWTAGEDKAHEMFVAGERLADGARFAATTRLIEQKGKRPER